jgi:hypothetical protein
MTRTRFFTICLLALTRHAALAGEFEASGSIQEIQGKLQTHLTKLAADGLFEAHRGKARWTYSFYTKVGKTSCEVVKIDVEAINAYRTKAIVTTVREEGGLLWSSTIRTPAQTPLWEAKIRNALR